jgi:hypothetical protein
MGAICCSSKEYDYMKIDAFRKDLAGEEAHGEVTRIVVKSSEYNKLLGSYPMVSENPEAHSRYKDKEFPAEASSFGELFEDQQPSW